MPALFVRFLSVTLLLACSLPSWAALSHAEAVNVAGMQRFLSQRMAKSYLMLAGEIRAEQAREQLHSSQQRFAENLQALRAYTGNPAQVALLETQENLWQTYQALLQQAPAQATARQVVVHSQQVLANAEQLVNRVEQDSNLHAAHLINRSGRQRMLSQRIALLYLAQSQEITPPDLQDQLQRSIDEFDQALQELQGASQNTPAISELLRKSGSHWRYSRSGFALAENGRYVPTVISVTSETLFQQMVSLTDAYTEVLGKPR